MNEQETDHHPKWGQADEDRLWLLGFSIEAAVLYHEARRSRLENYVGSVKLISIVGAFLAFRSHRVNPALTIPFKLGVGQESRQSLPGA